MGMTRDQVIVPRTSWSTLCGKIENLRIEAQVEVVGSPRRYGRWNGCTMKPAVVKKTHGIDASS